MANCIKCGAPLRDGAKFCGACGTKIEVRRFCTECGSELEPGEKFCTQCGTPAEGVSAPGTPAAPPTSQEFDLPYLVEDCDGGCRIRKYTGPEEGAVVIPPCIDGKKVVEIGASAFSGCDNLTGITIPYGVTQIGFGAFNGCWGLTSFTIPDSVAEIDANAFYNCGNLTSIAIPASVAKIGMTAFAYCDSMAVMIIPDSVTEIGGDAFHACEKLTIVTPAGSAAERYAEDYGIAVRHM